MTPYSNTSEPFTLDRDCPAILVPAGDEVVLPAGQHGYITQALGGSFTVYVEGNLFRIAGSEADALGKPPPPMPELPEDAGDSDVEKVLWQQLRTCYDPEIPINIVDLGLVYECNLVNADDGSRRVEVKMTLTAPGCGMGDVLVDEVRNKLELVPTIGEADVELVFDPPWGRHMMSEAARLETGMF
jgi:probable FeS assembly SUF system protein SufT